ncbi:hypothetical protein BJV82DRAFT_583452 [Fennellomyces sp. T-0311]|nr:hypothetical protein BJV82DRAFT_583452 [Fennellomyces sp. T-0311]
MANIPPDQAIAPIFEGFPDATRTVTRNCALKALTRPEYNFIQKESQHFSPRIKTSWTPSRSIKTVGNVPNTPAPNVLLQQNNWQSGNTADHMGRDLRSEPRATSSWRLGDNLNEVVNLNAITFGFSLQSDGVMAHLNFEKAKASPNWCFGYDHRRIDTKRSTTTRSLVGRDGIPTRDYQYETASGNQGDSVKCTPKCTASAEKPALGCYTTDPPENPYALHTSYDKKTKKKMASKPPSSGNCVFGVGEE